MRPPGNYDAIDPARPGFVAEFKLDQAHHAPTLPLQRCQPCQGWPIAMPGPADAMLTMQIAVPCRAIGEQG